jgi:hypothetical protein
MSPVVCHRPGHMALAGGNRTGKAVVCMNYVIRAVPQSITHLRESPSIVQAMDSPVDKQYVTASDPRMGPERAYLFSDESPERWVSRGRVHISHREHPDRVMRGGGR